MDDKWNLQNFKICTCLFKAGQRITSADIAGGIFVDGLEGRATQITEEMKLAAAEAIAGLVPADKLSDDNIMPEAFDPQVAEVVANAVKSHIR